MGEVIAGFNDILTLTNIIYIAFGVSLGIFLGAIPGLAAVTTVAIAIPLTYYLSPLTAISLLIGMLKGGYYGGAISAILLNAPGTPDSAASCFDGYPLAKAGKSLKAMKMALYASVFGDLFSDIVLILIAAPIAVLALKMGPPEITSLILFSMTIIAAFTGKSFLKALISAAMGMFLAMIGLDFETVQPRLTMGLVELEQGLPLIALFMGILVMSEFFIQMENPSAGGDQMVVLTKDTPRDNRRVTWPEFKGSLRTLFQSSVIGTAIGALPGLGATLAAFLAYGAAKKTSKNPELFGKGSLEGIAAVEAGNNATCGANLIPLFSLGIPGNLAAALLIGAFMIHGVTPGPLIFQEHGRLIYGIYGALMVANLFHLVIGLAGMRFFTKVLSFSQQVMLPLVILVSISGLYLEQQSLFPIVIMIIFTFIGYIMRKLDYSFITFIIGYVLAPLLESAFRQSMVMSKGNPIILVQRPISLVFVILTVIAVIRIIVPTKTHRPTTES